MTSNSLFNRVAPHIALRRGVATSNTTLQITVLWLALRCLTWIWAALVSTIRPMTDLERTISAWPPSVPLTSWLARVLLAPWQRWDVNYYLSIVEQGYQRDDGTAQFHPLLPWLAVPIAWLTHQPLLALVIVSNVAAIVLLVLFEQLAKLDLAPADARTSTLLLALSPMAFVFFAPYTEGLFLLCSVLCLLYARQRRWWLAGLAAAFATLTRQQGVFLVLPLAWELWEAADRKWQSAVAQWRSWLTLGLIPFGLFVWLAYRSVALSDLQANLDDPQALIYSLLISPSASKVVPVQAFLPPWQAFGLALAKMWREPELSLGVDLILGVGFIVLLGFAWRNLRTSYRIYAVVIALVSFSYYTGPFFPYMGLPRHLLLAVPVFVGLAPRLQHGWLKLCLLMSGLVGMLLLLQLYVLHGWTP